MACVTKNSSCVREAPREDRFEVCVGEVEGVGNELSLAGVRSVDLALADSASIDVRNTLERLDGTVDVTLKDLFIRWDVEHAGCTVRPEAPMDDGDRLAVAGLEVRENGLHLRDHRHHAQAQHQDDRHGGPGNTVHRRRTHPHFV